ncbi:MAG: DUF327 family protein [Spirochaetaceae bacterium]|jgi:uncharacterized protein YaaR (DUF327 family)|nr:DUF327 family protein [Spirochaetaceae bacterium]
MAKIETSLFFNAASLNALKPETKKTADKGSSRKVRFSGLLERLTQTPEPEPAEDLPFSEETVKAMLDEIHSAGDDLKNRPLPDEIKRYKEAVKRFLRYVVRYGYTAAKQVSGKNLLKRKNFTIVQVVDAKLEQLAAGIMAGQTAQLEILRRLEEITGILVDLLQ